MPRSRGRKLSPRVPTPPSPPPTPPQTGLPSAMAGHVGTVIGAAIAIVFGTMLTNIPFWTGLWAILGLLPAYFVCRLWCRIGGKYRLGLLALVGVWAVFAGVKAWQEYLGSNYRLKYRVCGDILSDGDGRFETAYLGAEFKNENDIDLFIRQESKSFTLGDRSSTTQLIPVTTIVHPSGLPEDDGKITDWLDFKPTIEPQELLGKARYTFKYGRDRDNLRNTLTVEGVITIPISADGGATKFRFTPTGDNGFVGYCDIRPHIYGKRTSESL